MSRSHLVRFSLDCTMFHIWLIDVRAARAGSFKALVCEICS